jgi:hypothetical protein
VRTTTEEMVKFLNMSVSKFKEIRVGRHFMIFNRNDLVEVLLGKVLQLRSLV